jgi:formate-dependent nitrite reductase membrane component NrfD
VEKTSVPLKPPVWTWEIPVYFYVGGAAGAAAVIAGMGQMVGRDPVLVTDARWIAAAGALLSPALLISDLGRPSRFLNMLRVFKWRSPMSIGAWALAAFSGAVFASLGLHALATPTAHALALAADLVAALTGSLLAVYTGVLIGVTAIPVWARHVSVLPLHFGASSLGVAVSILELTGHRTMALNGLGLGAAAIETVLGLQMEWSRDRVTRSLFVGSSGVLVRIGAWLTGPVPLVLRLVGATSTGLRLAAAVCMTVGSLATRFGWIGAGRHSASDRTSALNGDPA